MPGKNGPRATRLVLAKIRELEAAQEQERKETLAAAIDRLTAACLDADEKKALRLLILFKKGYGREPAPEIVALAEQASAKIWTAATPEERALIYGALPMPAIPAFK